MLDRFFTVFLLLSGFMLHGQPPANPQTSSSDTAAIYKLEGAVINAQTGRPVPFALVEATGRRRLVTLADSEGQFSFGNLSPGTIFVTARKPGFQAPGAREQNPAFTNVTVGPQTPRVELKLIPESTISGQVTDRDGEPLEGAIIEVLETRFLDGRRQLQPMNGGVRSDEDGNFRVGGLAPGRYYVAVRAATLTRRIPDAPSKGRAESYPAVVYFPSAPDIAGATPIDLGAGRRERIAFTLNRGPGFKLSGVVADVSAHQQVQVPMIADETGRPLFIANVWAPQTGKFEFSTLPAGTHSLLVVASDTEGGRILQRKAITLDKDVTDMTVVLGSGVTIPVVVRAELSFSPGPHSCSGSFPTVAGDTADCSTILAMVALLSAETGVPLAAARPISGKDPSLQFDGVAPGKYIVRAMPMRAAHVQSIRSGGDDLLREALVVPSGGQVPPIEVVLRDDGGGLTVHVRSDKPPEHGRILLISESAPNLPPVHLDIGATGDREYRDLPPGNYQVFAFDSIQGIEYANPEVMAKYNTKAATVTVTSGGSSTVTVDLIHTGD
jgi:hypothetical protein